MLLMHSYLSVKYLRDALHHCITAYSDINIKFQAFFSLHFPLFLRIKELEAIKPHSDKSHGFLCSVRALRVFLVFTKLMPVGVSRKVLEVCN